MRLVLFLKSADSIIRALGSSQTSRFDWLVVWSKPPCITITIIQQTKQKQKQNNNKKEVKKEVKREVKAIVQSAVPSASSAPLGRGRPQGKRSGGNAVDKARAALAGASPHMLSLALPGEVDPVRAGDAGSTTKTAIISTFDRAAKSALTGVVIIQKDAPLNAFIESVPSTGTSSDVYFAHGTSGTAPTKNFAPSWGIQQILPIVNLGQVTATAAAKQYAWTMDGDPSSGRRLWVDGGSAIQVFVPITAVVGTVTASLEVMCFDGENDVLVGTYRASATTITTVALASITTTKSGFYMFTMLVDSRTPATLAPTTSACTIEVTITDPASGNILAFRPVYGLVGISNEIEGARTNAAAVLVTNTTADLYRGGEIAGAQVAAGQTFAHVVAPNGVLVSSFFDEVSVLPGAQTLDASTGIYGYVKPTDSIEYFAFRDTFKSITDSSSVIGNSYAPIMSKAGMVFLAWSLPAGAPALLVSYYATVEYMTDVQTRERRASEITPARFDAEMGALKTAPQFMENPRHVPSLRAQFASGVSGFGDGRRRFLKEFRATDADLRKTIRQVAPRLMQLMDFAVGR